MKRETLVQSVSLELQKVRSELARSETHEPLPLSMALSQSCFAFVLLRIYFFGSKRSQFRIRCAAHDLRSHFLDSFLRTVEVLLARARLSLLLRYCARSFHSNNEGHQ